MDIIQLRQQCLAVPVSGNYLVLFGLVIDTPDHALVVKEYDIPFGVDEVPYREKCHFCNYSTTGRLTVGYRRDLITAITAAYACCSGCNQALLPIRWRVGWDVLLDVAMAALQQRTKASVTNERIMARARARARPAWHNTLVVEALDALGGRQGPPPSLDDLEARMAALLD